MYGTWLVTRDSTVGMFTAVVSAEKNGGTNDRHRTVVDTLCRLRLLNLEMVRATAMNIAQRFKELRSVVANATSGAGSCQGEVTQATALLVLAEVLQGSTLTVSLEGDQRSPLQVQVEQR